MGEERLMALHQESADWRRFREILAGPELRRVGIVESG